MGINIACFTGACQDSVATPQAPLLHGINIACFTGAREDSVATPQAPLLHGINIACFTGACQDSIATPQAPLLHGINIACFTGAREDSVASPQAPLLHGTLLVLQVHVRIASPPLKHPCYMGINIPTREELIANKMSVQELAKQMGVYISEMFLTWVDQLYREGRGSSVVRSRD